MTPRQRKIQVTRDSMLKVARILAGRGIAITQSGSQPYVKYNARTRKPERVNIPMIPDDASDTLITANHGFLDHEVGHVMFTDYDYLEMSNQANCKSLFNILEDTYVERMMQLEFAGSSKNLKKSSIIFTEMYIEPKYQEMLAQGDCTENDWWNLLCAVSIRAISGQEHFQEYMDADNKWALIPKLHTILKGFTSDIENIIASHESCQIAIDLKKIISGEEPRRETPEEQKEKEDRENDVREDDQSSQSSSSEKGDDDGDDEKGDDAGDSKESDGESESESDPSEDSQNENDDESEGGEVDESDSEEESESEEKSESEEDELDDEGSDSDSGEGSDSDDDEGSDSDSGEGSDSGDDEGSDPDSGEGSNSDEDSDSEDSDEDEDEDSDEDEDDEESEAQDGDVTNGLNNSNPEDIDPNDIATDESEAMPKEQIMSEEELEDRTSTYDDAMTKMIGELAQQSLASSSEYTPFTRDWDKIENHPISRHYKPQWSSQIADAVNHMVAPLSKSLERAFRAANKSRWEGGKKSGRINGAALSRLLVNDPRVMRTRQEMKTKDVAVTLLMDCSGSMSGGKALVATQASWALAEMLTKLGLPNEVLGFTTDHVDSSKRYLQKDLEDQWSEGMNYSRVDPINMPIFKSFEERFGTQQKARLACVPNDDSFMGGNIDGESLLMAAERLRKRTEPGKVMIVLSDGHPAGSRNGRELNFHLKDTVKSLTKEGINVVGIGINSKAVEEFYPKQVSLDNINDLPEEVMNQLREAILSKAK